MLGSACIDVGEVCIAKDSFDAGDFGFGSSFAAGGLGLAIGSLAGGALARASTDRSLYAPRSRSAASAYGLAAIAPERLVAASAVACGIRERRRVALQRPADPARRARPLPRPRVHRGDEPHVRSARAGHGRRRPGDVRARRPLDLGDRRRAAGSGAGFVAFALAPRLRSGSGRDRGGDRLDRSGADRARDARESAEGGAL
jgi:hypothetical protein